MKYSLRIILLGFSTAILTEINYAQIHTIYATGGFEVNWDEVEKELNDPNNDDLPMLYGSGCTDAPSRSNASSTLSSQGANNYYSKNIHDWDPRTAWVEGKSDYGIGEYFEVNLPYGGSNIIIFNGYQKSYSTWKNNSRVKKFKVYGDNKPLCYLILNDKMGYQYFDLTDDNYEIFRFEIIEVYQGEKWKDVAISEIASLGCCFKSNTTIQFNTKDILISEIQKGNEISSLNIETGKIDNTSIMKTAKQTHHTLLKIKTSKYTVELTPHHPLYIKGYGLLSLYELRNQQNFLDYNKMVNKIEVLVWNNQKQKSEYHKLISIEKIKGVFETYSILELVKGKTYIANGFVTSVY